MNVRMRRWYCARLDRGVSITNAWSETGIKDAFHGTLYTTNTQVPILGGYINHAWCEAQVLYEFGWAELITAPHSNVGFISAWIQTFIILASNLKRY